MHTVEIWTFRTEAGVDPDTDDIAGYGVEATDGSIGKIDEATYKAGSSYVVVDTGPWILGKKVLLPAGVISRVDRDEENVYVNRTKDQIKDSPEFDESKYREDEYRDRVGSYYGQGGPGHKDW